jgi:hypothetical protein
MSSYRRAWILCAVGCALIFAINCLTAFEALKEANGASATQGRAKLVRIDTTTVKNPSRNASSTIHTAVLSFESGQMRRELLEFPNQAYRDSDYAALTNQVSALANSTSITAYCSSVSCFSYAGAATITKLWLLISFLGFSLFGFLAFNAKKRQ